MENLRDIYGILSMIIHITMIIIVIIYRYWDNINIFVFLGILSMT